MSGFDWQAARCEAAEQEVRRLTAENAAMRARLAEPVQPLTQAHVDAIINASREAGEGPSALVRRVERAITGQEGGAA